MPNQETKPKAADLVGDARAALAELFRFQELKREQWLMRVSAGSHTRGWELLASDSQENNKVIKQRIRESAAPVTDLVGQANL